MLRNITIAGTILLAAGLACAAPTPITTCGNITAVGSYQLANSLSAAGNCLVLKTGQVTIDLNGFDIGGNGTGAAITDGGAQLARIVVRNGAIAVFQTGINLMHSQIVTVEDVMVTNSGTAIQAGDYVTVKNSYAGVNSANGIILGNNCKVIGTRANQNSGGAAISAGNNCTIKGNDVSYNQAYYAVAAAVNALITRNNVSSNGQVGIEVQDSSTVTDNVASYNGVDGILAGYNSTIKGNTASFNKKDGIQAYPNGVMSGNTVSSNARIGFFLTCPANLTGNVALNNPGDNYHLLGSGCATSDNF